MVHPILGPDRLHREDIRGCIALEPWSSYQCHLQTPSMPTRISMQKLPTHSVSLFSASSTKSLLCRANSRLSMLERILPRISRRMCPDAHLDTNLAFDPPAHKFHSPKNFSHSSERSLPVSMPDRELLPPTRYDPTNQCFELRSLTQINVYRILCGIGPTRS